MEDSIGEDELDLNTLLDQDTLIEPAEAFAGDGNGKSYISAGEYSLTRHLDSHLTRPRLRAHGKGHLYPSEASVTVFDEKAGGRRVLGGCLRASFFRLTEKPKGGKDIYIAWSGKHGETLEEMLVEQFKEMGIWVESQLEIFIPELRLSGKIDAIIAEPPDGTLAGVEIKTFYGYRATKEIFGNPRQRGKPKDSHLLQTLLYLWFLRDKVSYFRMLYFARDSNKHKDFKITLRDEPNGIVRGAINGIPETRFSVNDIIDRCKLLLQYTQSDETPPTDFQLVYDAERVEAEHKAGNVSKTAYAEWKKGKRQIGDYQCSYCPFKGSCWG